MADQRIEVSKDSLDSAAAYVRAALANVEWIKQLSPAGRDKKPLIIGDLNRALECLDQAPKQDGEL